MYFVRLLTIIANIIFMVIGMILLLSGLVAQLLYKDYLNFFNHSLMNIPVLFFFIGVTTAILAMLGLVGVCLNNRILLTTYVIVMVFILSVEVVASLCFYHYQDTVSLFVQHQLLTGLSIFNNPQYRGVTETWNVAQHELGCCGVTWYQDWDNPGLALTNLTHLGLSAHSVPDSCCRSDVVGCGRNILNLSLEEAFRIIHINGCYEILLTLVKNNKIYICTSLSGLAIVQITGVVLYSLILSRIQKNYDVGNF